MKLNNVLLLLCVAIFFVSCSREESNERQKEFKHWMEDNKKIKVLSTIAMIDDLVKQIGGDYIESLTLIKGDLDPHSYQLVKGDNEKFLRADLIFYNGLGLEHGASLQAYLQDSNKSIAIANKIQEKFPNLILTQNGQVDPHLWMDVSLWSKTIPFIVEGLSRIDSEHADYYNKNGKKLEDEMKIHHEAIVNELKSIPENKRYLVTSHDAFNYFARAYLATDEERNSGTWQKRFVAPEGLAPDSQLSARDLQLIIEHLKIYQVHILFPESNVSTDSIRKIIEAGQKLGLQLSSAKESLYGDAMGGPNSKGNTYLNMMKYNAEIMAKYWNEK